VFRALLFAIGVVVVVSTLPVNSSQPSAFADPAFSRYYARSSAAEQQLLWGGGPLVSLVEPFTGAPGNRRLVQYFERGRMEMADSTAGPTSSSISQGLLVREMATGYVQLGYDDFVQGEPAPIPLFGGSDADALTYADFAIPVASNVDDRTGELLDDWIAPGGVISEAAPPVEIIAGSYEPVTGHNIPHVTASWLKTDPFGIDANDALGLPISEPYWVHSGKGESGISLIQLFERRVVVYTPGLPLAERFSLTSAGRHYYRWRYGNDPGADTAAAPAQREVLTRADDSAGLSLPDGYNASILTNATDAFEIAVTPNGKLAVGYNDGRIELVDPRDPTAAPTTFVEHLANPAGFIWAGTDLYVVDDSGLHRYVDRDANGVADDDETIIEGSFERASVQLAAGPDATLFLTGRSADATGTAFADTSAPQLFQIAADALTPDDSAPATLDTASVNALLVDDTGAVWLVNNDGQLMQYLPATAHERTLLDASQFNTVRDILLYRPDGTSGNPYRDMLALADRSIVRLQPSRPDSASPSAGTGPAAIVDFITGFDRPTAMASGLDGSLYVLDTGRNVIYQITPS
jgi:hypothetical protein